MMILEKETSNRLVIHGIIKYSFKLLLTILRATLLTGCITYQKVLPPSAITKDAWFAKGKLKHFSVSFLIGVATYSVARWGNASKNDASIAGLSLSSTCGVAKEIDDEVRRNNWSYKDLAWDFLGSGVGVSLSNALD